MTTDAGRRRRDGIKRFQMGHDGERLTMRCVDCGDLKSFADDADEEGMGSVMMKAHGAAHQCWEQRAR